MTYISRKKIVVLSLCTVRCVCTYSGTDAWKHQKALKNLKTQLPPYATSKSMQILNTWTAPQNYK